jgi:RNA polymerase sigma-70 factor (ECF subfamily)
VRQGFERRAPAGLADAPEAEARRRERFERVFDAHFRAVLAYALRRAGHAEAEDAVAETFLVAWRRLDEVPEDPRPWLLGTARRVLANQRRAAGRRTALGERLAREREVLVETFHDPPIVRALGRLSESDRELLLLVAWEGLSTEQAAEALGCSRAALKVRLHRARRRLRAELEALERRDAAQVRGTALLEECHEE